jgi:hypothetical protein
MVINVILFLLVFFSSKVEFVFSSMAGGECQR